MGYISKILYVSQSKSIGFKTSHPLFSAIAVTFLTMTQPEINHHDSNSIETKGKAC